MGGPVGVADTVRAGDEGEYHHSKNLMKNIAVGSNTFSESSKRRGERNMSRRSVVSRETGAFGELLLLVACCRERCVEEVSPPTRDDKR